MKETLPEFNDMSVFETRQPLKSFFNLEIKKTLKFQKVTIAEARNNRRLNVKHNLTNVGKLSSTFVSLLLDFREAVDSRSNGFELFCIKQLQLRNCNCLIRSVATVMTDRRRRSLPTRDIQILLI